MGELEYSEGLTAVAASPRLTSVSVTAETSDPITIAAGYLSAAREHERLGQVDQAVAEYDASIAAADPRQDRLVLAEALRRLGAIRRRQHQPEEALRLCGESFAFATLAGSRVLAAEALNGTALVHLEHGRWADARAAFHKAIELGADSPAVVARIEQNLGIIANIQGDLPVAREHYGRSLAAFDGANDDRGRALAYHNLGMISCDVEDWDAAERHFAASREIAERLGEAHLRALCLLNQTEVCIARGNHEQAKSDAEEALREFTRTGALVDKASAYRVLGVVYRETDRPDLSEARLQTAVEIGVEARSPLSEAEARRELARLYQSLNRNQDALRALNAAHRLFGQLDARRDLVDVAGKRGELERVYLDVVSEWGQSIESADSYTHGHCERVATYAVALATVLGVDEAELTTVRLGAYLHDLGKIRVPHEILNKPGKLTPEEFAIMQRHPVDGVELLAGIGFPWDIMPIIRWHHERLDGTGYPDGIGGEAFPLQAQIIGIADVYDALTSTRSYRPAMAPAKAVTVMCEMRHHWSVDVFECFVRTVPDQRLESSPPPGM